MLDETYTPGLFGKLKLVICAPISDRLRSVLFFVQDESPRTIASRVTWLSKLIGSLPTFAETAWLRCQTAAIYWFRIVLYNERDAGAMRFCLAFRQEGSRAARNFIHIDKAPTRAVKWPGSTVSHVRANRECGEGTGTRFPGSDSAAAPATVSGEPEPQSHWDIPGRR